MVSESGDSDEATAADGGRSLADLVGDILAPNSQAITGFHEDEFNEWVAQLACGHFQHVRHNPP